MKYQELKAVAKRELPEMNCCYDCGEILHFVDKGSDTKGLDVAIHKQTGEILPFILCIEEGMVTKAELLDFETGIPAQEECK